MPKLLRRTGTTWNALTGSHKRKGASNPEHNRKYRGLKARKGKKK